MAAVIVLEAIFEADLTDEQYAYRPKRSAHQAVREGHKTKKSLEVYQHLSLQAVESAYQEAVHSLNI